MPSTEFSSCSFQQDCPKGHLTKEQFIKVYKDFFPSGSAEGFCEHVFRTFDTDNSGFIDFKEFLLAINVTSSGTPEQKLEWAFRMYDIDGNGTIDEKEMIKIIEVGPPSLLFPSEFLSPKFFVCRVHYLRNTFLLFSHSF